jgi:hypothetical protein
MGFGDLFSIGERTDSFNRQFIAGAVCKLFCDFTVPPKEKLLVVGCVSPHPLLLVINSEINEFYRRRQHLFDRQVKILADEHDFLDHDSFVDCAQTIEAFSKNDLEHQVVGDMQRMRGYLSPSAKVAVRNGIMAARTISVLHKQWILADFNVS